MYSVPPFQESSTGSRIQGSKTRVALAENEIIEDDGSLRLEMTHSYDAYNNVHGENDFFGFNQVYCIQINLFKMVHINQCLNRND